jgi:chemotaxis protein methyltransferase CheR
LDLSAGEFEQLRDHVHKLCGLALTREKTYLVKHRLAPVAQAAGCQSFAAFLKRLASPEAALLREPIIEAITTKETSFFRDPHLFETVRSVILPELAARIRHWRESRESRQARIWCAAVSTGQEAYSLAMIIDEFVNSAAGSDLDAKDFVLLATDISPRALEAARAGRYNEQDMKRGVSQAFRMRYFRPVKQEWVIADKLRDMIEFRRINLTDNFTALGMVDVIFCRNVLIYFDDARRQRICEHFAEMLRPKGLLILGAAENLYGIATRFASEHKGPTLVYRKT